MLEEKRQRREHDEARKALHVYREEELQQMWLNFFGADHSYHLARKHFVYKGNLPARERCNGDFGCKSSGPAEILDGRAMSAGDQRTGACRGAPLCGETGTGTWAGNCARRW